MKLNVSLVIVHYKCWDYLEKNLLSIQKQTRTTEQIIIINNGSVVNLKEKLEGFKNLPIKLINNKINIGFGAACNQATHFINDDALILFCNPDVEIPTEGIETLLHIYQSTGVKLLGCKQTKSNGKSQKVFGVFPSLKSLAPIFGRNYSKCKSESFESINDVKIVDWITGAVILISKNDFNKINGFDEDYFMFMEDVDLCLRARRQGMEIGTTSATSWIHHHGKSSIHSIKDRINSKTESIKSKHKYIQKNIPNHKSLTHISVFLKYAPELFFALIIGVFIPIKEIKVKQKVALNLLSYATKSLLFPAMRINNG